MRIFLLTAVLAAIVTGSAHAASYDDPKALVTALYQPYTHGDPPADLPGFYSDGLKAMFAKHQQLSQITGVGLPPKPVTSSDDEFDPFVNAKRYLMLDLTISDAVINGDHAVVGVSYKNFDHPTVLSVSLTKSPDGWKVDDIASLGADQHWLLSWLLTYDPMGIH